MMAHERCPEEDAEAILSNLKMEGRRLECQDFIAHIFVFFVKTFLGCAFIYLCVQQQN